MWLLFYYSKFVINDTLITRSTIYSFRFFTSYVNDIYKIKIITINEYTNI